MFSQQSLSSAHVQCLPNADDCLRIFRTDVEHTLFRSHGISSHHHTLNYSQWIRLQQNAIHERTRVALIAVTNHDGSGDLTVGC